MNKIPQEEIDLIMDKFDFEKVHKAMIATGWQWTTHSKEYPREMEIPSLQRVMKTARRLLASVADGKAEISTCGFIASREKREDGTDFLILEFVPESADSEFTQ